MTIGQNTVWASSYHLNRSAPLPDLMIGLTPSWFGEFSYISVSGNLTAPETLCDTIMLDWMDGGVPDMKSLFWTLAKAKERIEQGKRVEIGCLGGHGRTGTLLAILVGQIEKVDAKTAILAVRKRYCKEVVETTQQAELVYHALGESSGDLWEWWVEPKVIWAPYAGGAWEGLM